MEDIASEKAHLTAGATMCTGDNQRFPRRASEASLSSAGARASMAGSKVTTALKQATYESDYNVPFPRTAGAVFGGNGAY